MEKSEIPVQQSLMVGNYATAQGQIQENRKGGGVQMHVKGVQMHAKRAP